jgi:hypothetical protein
VGFADRNHLSPNPRRATKRDTAGPTFIARPFVRQTSRRVARHHPRVSFEQALAFLTSLVGERVAVAIESPASGLVAHYSGTLAQAHELAAREEPAPLFFSFDDGGSGFVVAPAAFAGATGMTDGVGIRVEDTAGVAITIERAHDRDEP